jgi:hypothetical protein
MPMVSTELLDRPIGTFAPDLGNPIRGAGREPAVRQPGAVVAALLPWTNDARRRGRCAAPDRQHAEAVAEAARQGSGAAPFCAKS